MAEHSRSLLDMLSGWSDTGDVSPSFPERRAVRLIKDVAEDWRGAHLPPENWVSRLLPLVGLGPGLTPMGDDFISGYLAAAWLLSESGELRETLQTGGVRLAAGDTTFYSKNQIAFAGRGICLRSIFLLVQSVSTPLLDRARAEQVLSIGETSGRGWVMGIATAASQASAGR
jgi:hypothetical protein